jgi:hypothetical protein
MSLLQSLRTARRLTGWVLLGFVLSLSAAMASPIVNPQSTELICTGSGAMKLIVIGQDAQDGDAQAQSAGMDCPLCVTPAAPPSQACPASPSQQALAHVLQPIAAAHIAALTAAPLPARGPPLLQNY